MSLNKTSNIIRFFIGISFMVSMLKPVVAQEMLGLVNSNFAGSAGLSLNPSSLVNSKLYMDIHLISGDIFAENNYLYIHREDYRLFKMFGPNGEVPAYGKNNSMFDRFINTELKNAYTNIRLQGPSFMMVWGDHAFGFYTAARSVLSLRRLPYEIPNFLYEGLEYEKQHNINYVDKNFSLTNLEWAEFGLTYSTVIYERAMDRFTAGITLKYLAGVTGGYMNVSEIDYIVLNDSTVNVNNLNAEIGVALPVNYETNDAMLSDPLFKGRGFGVDLGMNYLRMKRGAQQSSFTRLCRQSYPDYFYKLGFSLIDLGRIRFRENARLYEFNDVNASLRRLDTLNYYNLDQIMGYLSEQFYGDPDALEQGDEISIFLPSAFSAQFDYQFLPGWYVNSTAVVPIPLGKARLHRPAQLSITPRFEHWLYEVSLPVSLYDMRYPRIGLAARFAFLTVGTDKLGGFFGMSDFTGMDIYFAIKINFTKGRCPFTGRSTYCTNDEYGPSRKRRK